MIFPSNLPGCFHSASNAGTPKPTRASHALTSKPSDPFFSAANKTADDNNEYEPHLLKKEATGLPSPLKSRLSQSFTTPLEPKSNKSPKLPLHRRNQGTLPLIPLSSSSW
uniref:Uncharacterized protein n=1 Tax=Arabidopsis thaliana TaxID=3702 RepID=Q0WML5_ARATH|nr:hypothetical protein [Arabidopsis thaliana]